MNSMVFISYFNKVEKGLRKLAEIQDGGYHNFTEVFHAAKRTHHYLGRYYQDLMEIKELRNAIVHDSMDPYVIAEPCDEIVERLKVIYEKIISPKMVIELLPEQGIKTVALTSPLEDVMKLVRLYNLSQFPVVEDHKIIGIITTNAITIYLSEYMEDNQLILDKTQIHQIFDQAEDRDDYSIISRHTTSYDVEEILQTHPNCKMIMITESGKNTQRILRVLSTWDYRIIYEEL